MILKEIDDASAAWTNQLAAVAANLLELQADATYRLLTGTGGVERVALTGATAARVQPALAAMPGIFEHFGLLHATLEQAAKLRASLPALFGAEARLREIEALLTGPSIRLPAPAIAFDERSLLTAGGAEQRVTPNDLLESMTKEFSAARDAVLAVAKAWDGSALALARCETRRDRLLAQLTMLRTPAPPELHAVSGILAEIKARMGSDPLGAHADLEARAEQGLAKAQALAEAAEAMRRAILEARVQFEELLRLRHEAQNGISETREKIAEGEPVAAPLSADNTEALRAWLDRLDVKRTQGLLDAVRVGLRNWTAVVEEGVAQARAVCAAARQPLEARAELRGRLEALKAKARVYGVAERADIADRVREAEMLLYTQPTDLQRAAEAVAVYEAMLQGGAQGGTKAGPKRPGAREGARRA